MWKKRLERMLREDRPAPDEAFLRLAVGRVEVDTGRPRARAWVLRPILTLALVAGIVAAFAALGGFSSLKSAATQNRHLSPFAAAALNYCTQSVVVTAVTSSPTTSPTINFSVNFNQSVIGFTNSDVVVGGTAGGTKTAVVSGGPQTYNVAVTGMTSAGTVTVMIPANAATDTGGTCATPASNTASVTYSTLAITSYSEDGNSGNGSLSGVGAGAGAGTITITVCTVNSFPCATANKAATYPVTPNGDGTFATGQNKLAKGTTFYAQAVQGAVQSQPFQFSNA